MPLIFNADSWCSNFGIFMPSIIFAGALILQDGYKSRTLIIKELQSSQALLCLFELLFTILDYTFYAMVNLREWYLQALSTFQRKVLQFSRNYFIIRAIFSRFVMSVRNNRIYLIRQRRKFLNILINRGGWVENFRGHLIRELKRMLEATAGYITV